MSFDFVRLCMLAASVQMLAVELPDRITPSARHLHAKTGLEVVSGEVILPRAFLRGYLRLASGETGLVSPQLFPVGPADPKDKRELTPFQVVALRRGHAPEARLELMDSLGVKAADMRFPMPTRVGDGKPLQHWLTRRTQDWELHSDQPNPLRMPLRRAAASAYGFEIPDASNLRNLRQREAQGGPSLLALLGGRAAVDETLQLDRPLARRDRKGVAEPGVVPLASIAGITTPPHPWADMRTGGARAATPLPLADCVPPDRALLYLPKPKAALASLEGAGAAFLQRVSSFSGNGGLDTGIVTRTLEDLGLGDGRGRKLIESGAVREAVLYFPDLAFMAGTEATVVADLARPEAGAFIPGGGVHAYKTAGGQAYAARRGGRIFLSTSKAELKLALDLHASGGKHSLGRSDEFAVVLDKLAPNADTEVFAYLSDAFIRGLVGPRQRILQARQAEARLAMEDLAAGALLRRLDAPGEAVTLADLKTRGYVSPDVDPRQLSLTPAGEVRHAVFGRLERLHPLARVPLTEVSAGEAAAYAAFKEAYSRYWSRYFDPIAFRLDAKGEGRQELETFVLPLLDSSIYLPMKALLTQSGPLPHPRWHKPMVAELGLRMAPLGDDALPRPFDGVGQMLGQIGTGVLVAAFPDAAPVIATGDGSPATILETDPFNQRNGLMGLGALGLGLFTRPVVFAVELKDPEQTRKSLRDVVYRMLPPSLWQGGELDAHLRTEADGSLQLRLGFLRLASMSFTLRVEDRWLILSNDASLPASLVAGTEPGEPFAASLRLHPEALERGLPAAFQAAVEGESRSAFSAMAWLGPWLRMTGDVKAAQAESHRILGVAPLLDPDSLRPGRWLEHRDYGRPIRPTTPVRDPAKDFGLLEGVRDPRVDMRFEDTGLRARISWRR
ncbi:MAG: hypothetical protein Q8K67_10590 [Geothrix sp.]|nr:hypothetical protein [Geothrix sp.]